MEKWQRLFELAENLKALKPWNFLYEDDIFGVRDPETGKLGFISFMGSGGEHTAMSVYLGERALTKFFSLGENHDLPPETVLEIPQLQISFEDREYLEKEDRELIKSLGRKYSGKAAWPFFRSFRPGMVPWFLDDAEKQSMIHFLEQALDVVVRADAADLIRSGYDEPTTFLIRDYMLKNGKPSWKDTFQRVTELPPVEIPFTLPSDLIGEVAKLPVGKMILEADVFMTPAQVRSPGIHPFFSYMLMLVEKESGFVLGFDLLDPSDGLESMYGKVPAILLGKIKNMKLRPREIHVTSEVLVTLGAAVSERIKIPFTSKSKLPALKTAKKEVMGFFSQKN